MFIFYFVIILLMNSKTFQEKLVNLDFIKQFVKKNFGSCQEPLQKKWSNFICNTYFNNKQLQFKLYKYNSGCYYLHDFREWHQMKYTYVPGKAL